MLCINEYAQEFVDDCRARVNVQLAAYSALIAAARAQSDALNDPIATFEPVFFNNLVLMLDNLFCHRSRMLEKKDGNPLNEVRLICESLLHNGGTMIADKSIKLDPAKSVLKYRAGDEIGLSEADFVRLSEAFFAEIERKFVLPVAVN
jgi:hypothetical protein